MRLTLHKITIQNFKGVQDLSIDFGKMTKIGGANGTGKSTIADAFAWVLWNKDSQGNAPGTSDFQEKPRDEDGNEIHNLDTTVELDCTLDSLPFKLRRTQRENWVKKRGSTDAVFQGNVSTYWINEVETKLTDFRARINEIASEEAFRLIGSLSAFNAMEWKKRRDHLISLTDIDADAYLLQQDKYRQLADEAAQRGVTVEDLRKILADQRKRTNTELQMFPVRIDEARKALPVFVPGEVEAAKQQLKALEDKQAELEAKIAQAKASATSSQNDERIYALEAEVVILRRAISTEHHALIIDMERERDAASANFVQATNSATYIEGSLARIVTDMQKATAERENHRRAYTSIYESTYDASSVGTVCPACDRPLPEDQVQAAIEKQRQMFDDQRKAQLLDIKQKGIKASQDIERLEAEIKRLSEDVAEAKAKAAEASTARDAAYAKLHAIPREPDYSVNPKIASTLAEIEQLKAARNTSPDEALLVMQQEKQQLTQTAASFRAILAKQEAGQATEARIAELEKQQHEAAARIGELEQMIALVEQFTQDRCKVLEDSINAKFPTVRWKLFETQINGGIADICQAYIPCASGLVSYGSANTAAQINADIEIVNVLSQHHGVSLPLFADNAERVNRLAHTDTQLISLQVTTDSALTVEIEHEEAV